MLMRAALAGIAWLAGDLEASPRRCATRPMRRRWSGWQPRATRAGPRSARSSRRSRADVALEDGDLDAAARAARPRRTRPRSATDRHADRRARSATSPRGAGRCGPARRRPPPSCSAPRRPARGRRPLTTRRSAACVDDAARGARATTRADAAIAAGRALDRAAALARLDPATLDAVAVGPQRERDEDRQQAGHPAERPQRRREPIGPPSIRPRSAPTRWVSGLTSVNVCSQPGSVSAGRTCCGRTSAGTASRNMMPCTAPGVRAIMPTNTETQHRHSAKPIASRQAASTSRTLVVARKPRRSRSRASRRTAGRSGRRRRAPRRPAAPRGRSAGCGSGRRRPSRCRC